MRPSREVLQERWGSAQRWISSGALIIVSITALLAVYLWGAMQQAERVNRDVRRSDQGAYLRSAEKMRATGFRYLGDRNRMPLYPAIQALFLDPEAGTEAIFERAKRINILLSVLLLAALVPMLRVWLPLWQTLEVVLITAFTVFMFKAGWVQAELLFYFLSFAAWLALVQLLLRPSWRMGLLAGVLSGFAYLTKASMLPTVAVFVVWSVGLAANELLAGRREEGLGLARLVSTGAVLLLALAVVFPYLSDNKRIYGRWFYNVNTRFNFWCDSWSEVEKGTKAHGAQWRWPDLPPEEIPSLGRYLRLHTAGQIAERITNGSRVVVSRMSHSYGYFKYAALEVLLAAFLLSRNRAWAVDLVKRRWALAGFLATYFSVSFLLVAWYVPIATGNRFILGHFLPLLFTSSMIATRAPETKVAGRPIVRLASRSILVLLILDLAFQLLPHTLSINGGH